MSNQYTKAENILSCHASAYTSSEDDSSQNTVTVKIAEAKTEGLNEILSTSDVDEVSEGHRVANHEDEYVELKAEIKLLAEEDIDLPEEQGTFEGYASVFGNTDLGNDVIKKGAFTESLKARKPKGIKLLYQHKSDMPIGVFDDIKEDGTGLHVKGRLALKTTAGRDAYELLKMGALDAMSIGFRANPDEVSYDKRAKKRTIGEVDLLEISLVTFPMNPKALIRSVKATEISIREWENGMRDAFSLSRSQAKVAAKAVHQIFDVKTESSETLPVIDENMELVNAIKKLTLTLNTS
jgi:hypothetical protein